MGKLISKIMSSKIARRIILLLFDIFSFTAVSGLYYFFKQNANGIVTVDTPLLFIFNGAIHLALTLLIRAFLSVYNNVWRYTSTKAYFLLITADSFAGIITIIVLRAIGTYNGMWQATFVGAFACLLALSARIAYNLVYKYTSSPKNTKTREPVAIVGAGRLATYLAGDLSNNPNSKMEPLFYVDTDPTKIGNKIGGLQVHDKKNAEKIIRKLGIKKVIIAITNKSSEEMSKLYYHYAGLGCEVKVFETLIGKDGESKASIREFNIEDLLFREAIDIKTQQAGEYYKGKTVLITGGGGSIGSELCRQVAECETKQLIIFDIYENNAYEIQQELVRKYKGELDLVVLIGSVRDTERLEAVFKKYKPDVVFHAAAHKHVPLMEVSAAEAIKNNVVGTYNTANMAEKYGVKKFILVSTDKAVNPTNIMGASKRMCEMVVQCRTDSTTSFAAVRFGNVLGSNGSVIPLFKRQIEEGGPITITDSRIIRYFMTIPEASRLVMTAGAMAESGQLFVLDMGKPVKIYDLALDMIKLSGLEPFVDIQIKEIGLRPGEKLYEELLIKSEDLDKTANEKIFVEKDKPLTREQVDAKIARLMKAVNESENSNCDIIREAMHEVVPTYKTPEEVNEKAAESNEMKMARTK